MAKDHRTSDPEEAPLALQLVEAEQALQLHLPIVVWPPATPAARRPLPPAEEVKRAAIACLGMYEHLILRPRGLLREDGELDEGKCLLLELDIELAQGLRELGITGSYLAMALASPEAASFEQLAAPYLEQVRRLLAESFRRLEDSGAWASA